MEFCCTGTEKVSKVTVGEGALNILTRIVREGRPMFDAICLKDRAGGNAEGDCVADRYLSGKKGKQNWLKAYRQGKVHYEKFEY